ncbi:hypothetical protein EW146_g3601 [Bondarzewia mesenterica]|uniref:Uncharacterized protein n=1 Tax=Bondarzewia mesenterica TaxID=1095465 RepID=A0A4S4LYX3_9AGAM|nr:hypothetical protein EW146_g3601 [Bondarzewia mesenterica]
MAQFDSSDHPLNHTERSGDASRTDDAPLPCSDWMRMCGARRRATNLVSIPIMGESGRRPRGLSSVDEFSGDAEGPVCERGVANADESTLSSSPRARQQKSTEASSFPFPVSASPVPTGHSDPMPTPRPRHPASATRQHAPPTLPRTPPLLLLPPPCPPPFPQLARHASCFDFV